MIGASWGHLMMIWFPNDMHVIDLCTLLSAVLYVTTYEYISDVKSFSFYVIYYTFLYRVKYTIKIIIRHLFFKYCCFSL